MTILLQSTDPHPVEEIAANGDSPTALVCEHAGCRVPTKLKHLGLSQKNLHDHIGWDIGAAAVTRDLAARLGAPAVLQRYSRLIIDCNRPPEAPDSIPAISHGIAVPANQNLGSEERQQRLGAVFEPFDAALQAQLSRGCRFAFSIHSFTPNPGDQRRPWDIGFLYRKDTATSSALASMLKELEPHLTIGMNEPYEIDDESDWFVPRYAEPLSLQHSLIEIRNDHLRTVEGQQWWSDRLASIIGRLTAT